MRLFSEPMPKKSSGMFAYQRYINQVCGGKNIHQKQETMKKVFAILAITAAFAACNNAAESTEKTIDSTANAAAATTTIDSVANKVDSTVKAATDSVKAKVDSLKK